MSARVLVSFGVAVAMVALAGCGNPRQMLGLDKSPPDEFAVVTRAPLSLPPDYSLRPPQPGAVSPQDQQVTEMARAALTGTQADLSARQGISEGERTLLQQSGAASASADIRSVVDRETSVLAEESKTFTDRLVFWREDEDPATIVNAEEEAKRIRTNQALGQPVTQGETPKIERRRKALLEGLF